MTKPSEETGQAALYQRISDQLLRLIQNGEYPVGSKLPTERELCEQFSVSRHTAREAVRRLGDLGLIERRRRAGTVVIRQHPQPKFGLTLNTTDQLERYLKFTDLHVVRVTSELHGQPPEVELDGGYKGWIKASTYRSVPGSKRAISWTDVYLRDEYASIVDKIGTRPGGVYPLLVEYCNETIEVIRMEISASRFPPEIARQMNYDASDPALLMIRTFTNPEGKIMEVAVSYYPPYDFRYVATLVPNP